MARPVEYDKQLVLEKAMQAFCLKGYEGTSIAELIQATGLTSRSMYNVFGSKNGLFKAVLEQYYERTTKQAILSLEAGTGLGAVRKFIRSVSTGEHLNGCLMVNTLSEKNLVNPDCVRFVTDHFNNLERLLASKLEYAKQEEGFQSDPQLKAKQLVVMLHGMALYVKSGSSLSEMKTIVEDFLQQIGI